MPIFLTPLRHDTDDEVATAKRSRDVDALRRRKHKKNKKHKKTSKYDKATKERSKKHKKVKRKPKSESESSAGSSDSSEKIVITNETAASTTATSLSSKFAEIMKTNGHTTGTVIPPKLMRKPPKIPTDPNKLVEMITQSLDQTEPSLEIVSSESDSDGGMIPVDVDSPDVAVIEDELNLEELMKQKALLQARLGVITSDTDEDEPIAAEVVGKVQEEIDKSANDVILLVDDSSGEAIRAKTKVAAQKRVAKRSRSRSREKKRVATGSTTASSAAAAAAAAAETRSARPADGQMVRDRYGSRAEYEQQRYRKRNDNDNRFKEDLRREIDRDKERSFREREQRRRDGGPIQGQHQGGAQDRSFGRDRPGRGYSAERDRRQGGGGMRSRSRERGGDQHDRGYGGRYKRRGEEKKDKFVGSLSEGQKPDKESSSDSEVGNINVNDDDDDDEKIIEQRRKKREELLKVNAHAIDGSVKIGKVL